MSLERKSKYRYLAFFFLVILLHREHNKWITPNILRGTADNDLSHNQKYIHTPFEELFDNATSGSDQFARARIVARSATKHKMATHITIDISARYPLKEQSLNPIPLD